MCYLQKAFSSLSNIWPAETLSVPLVNKRARPFQPAHSHLAWPLTDRHVATLDGRIIGLWPPRQDAQGTRGSGEPDRWGGRLRPAACSRMSAWGATAHNEASQHPDRNTQRTRRTERGCGRRNRSIVATAQMSQLKVSSQYEARGAHLWVTTRVRRLKNRTKRKRQRFLMGYVSICEGISRGHAESTFCLSVCGRNSKLNSLLSDLPMRAFQSWGSFETVPRVKLYCSFVALEKFLLNFLGEIKHLQ